MVVWRGYIWSAIESSSFFKYGVYRRQHRSPEIGQADLSIGNAVPIREELKWLSFCVRPAWYQALVGWLTSEVRQIRGNCFELNFGMSNRLLELLREVRQRRAQNRGMYSALSVEGILNRR